MQMVGSLFDSPPMCMFWILPEMPVVAQAVCCTTVIIIVLVQCAAGTLPCSQYYPRPQWCVLVGLLSINGWVGGLLWWVWVQLLTLCIGCVAGLVIVDDAGKRWGKWREQVSIRVARSTRRCVRVCAGVDCCLRCVLLTLCAAMLCVAKVPPAMLAWSAN
jgi:hypothetical protein